jgi:hypothetical protein
MISTVFSQRASSGPYESSSILDVFCERAFIGRK